MILKVPVNLLLAVNIFTERAGYRPELGGVLVTPDSLLVGTNGKAIAVGKFDEVEYFQPTIIPNTLIDQIKVKKKVEHAHIVVDGDEIILAYCDLSIVGNRIEGRFPDWRRHFKFCGVSGVAQLTPEFGVLLCKAAKLFDAEPHHVTIAQYGAKSPSVVNISVAPNFVALLMPLNTTSPENPIPYWLSDVM